MKNNIIQKIIIVMFFFVLLFVSIGNISNQGSIFVSYIQAEKSVFVLVIGMVGLGYGLINNRFKFNYISTFLIIRLIYFVITCMLIGLFELYNSEIQYGIILAYFMCICFYYIGYSNGNKNFFNIMCFVSICIITIQLIITFFGRSLNYFNVVDMKWWMIIPIGQTNTVGCYLTGLLIYFNCSNKNNVMNIIALVLTLISILLTYSRSALIIYALYFCYIILKDLKVNKKNIVLKVFFLFIVLSAVLLFLVINNDISFERFSIDSMSSSRLQVYKEGIDLFFDNVLIGIGAYKYHIHDAYKAHNWILETLIETGIIGNALFMYIIIKVIENIKKTSPEMLVFVFFYLIHGLVEPNLYTVSLDSFFWLLIGSCMTKDKS